MNGFVQMPILSSTGMLVKRETTARFPIQNLESCSTISSAKENYSFTVYLLQVKIFKIGQKGEQLSMITL